MRGRLFFRPACLLSRRTVDSPGMRRWLRRAGWAGVGVVALLLGAWLWEHFSGLSAWRQAQATVAAAGESFDRPAPEPPIPESENFCATALMRDAMVWKLRHNAIIQKPANHEALFDELIATARERPRARHVECQVFQPDDLTGIITVLRAPSLAEALPRLLAERAERCFAEREPGKAWDLFVVQSRLLEAAVHLDHPVAIYLLVFDWRHHVALARSGLARHAWDAGALSAIEAEARALDLRAVALRGERHDLCALAAFADRLLADRQAGLQEYSGVRPVSDSISLMARCAPDGFFRRGEAQAALQLLGRRLLPLRDDGLLAWWQAVSPPTETSWRATLEGMMFTHWSPARPDIARESLRAEISRRHLLLACALERAFAKDGHFPETLAAITGNIPAEVGLDLDGQPMRYRVAADGLTYRLWSVGVNLVDDSHGVPPIKPKRPRDEPDWHWQVP